MSKKRIEILSSIAQRSEELQVLSSFDTKNAAPDYIIADATISLDQLSTGLGFESSQIMANQVDLVRSLCIIYLSRLFF